MALYKSNYPDGFVSNSTPSVISILGVIIETFTITATDIANGYIDLSGTPNSVATLAMDWEGIDQYQSVDYTVSVNRIYFTTNLLNNLDTGDLIKVSYQ
jgi:hypothetical protein